LSRSRVWRRVVEFRSVADSFRQAYPGGDARPRRVEGTREQRDGAPGAAVIAPEIAFLVDEGIDPGLLLEATTAAARCGVDADAALLGEALVAEEAYYRALARRLGVPYFHSDLAIADDVDAERAVASGVAPLAANGAGLRVILAPRGAMTRWLLFAATARPLQKSFAISSPQRLSALVRAKAGARVAEAASRGLERRDRALCARGGLSYGQIVIATVLAGAGLAFARVDPSLPIVAFSVVLWLVFAAAIVVRNLAVAASTGGNRPPPPPADAELPVYSVVAALYRETAMVRPLVAALDALDYPKAKLDIKLVVERRDIETLAAIVALRLPARYEVIVAPPGAPSTKPRALNVALPALRGELVVVYDAEDRPDPDQLRLAAAAFAADRGLDCLQARLVIDNPSDSWLSAMFAIEYAALFDLLDPGLAALGLPLPLGGSSNHFRARTLRRVGGWDAWNVTEDADLGVRLARERARVGALASDTREEAPSDLASWFRQRTRWQKGWMQTLIVHSREPARVLRALGPTRALAAVALIGGSVLGGLFGPALAGEALWHAVRGDLAKESLWSVAGDVAIYTLMALGLMTVLAPAVAASRRRGLAASAAAFASLPLYYALISAASWAALIDLAIRPFHWAKTEHDRSRAAVARALRGRPHARELSQANSSLRGASTLLQPGLLNAAPERSLSPPPRRPSWARRELG